MDDIYAFEKLDAWIQAKELAKLVYKLVAKFPNYEQFALCSQVRRAMISVPSNIAEGVGRMSYKEKIHFLEIAYGSLMETYCQLQIAVEVGYITNNELENIKPSFFTTSRLISGLRRSFENSLNNEV
ncbi:MAG: four helix bundle protein [Muribaculaceae bacterium]|nr:four helix bundle protein [Muribaculaceae bacterium]